MFLCLSNYVVDTANTYRYWDEPRDAGNFSSSVVFDSIIGFGGDGSGPDSCITTGPFANYTNSLGPGYLVTDHCIERAISDQISLGSSQAEVDKCDVFDTFEEAWPCIQTQPHIGGHVGTGGEVCFSTSFRSRLALSY